MKKLLFALTLISIPTCVPYTMQAQETTMIFNANIMDLSRKNNNFRHVIATGSRSQIVLMSLLPGQDIGDEVHADVDQVLVFVEGSGVARIKGKEYTISAGDIFLVPAGTQHNFTNTGHKELKLFTVYAPAEFDHEIIQKLKPIDNK